MAIIFGKNREIDFSPSNLMSFGKSFSRMNGQPLDESEIWYDRSALEKFAASNAAYVGMRVTYINEKEKNIHQYIIQFDGSLLEANSACTGDNKTIEINNGLASIFGSNTAEPLTIPRLKADKTGIEWVSLSKIVEGGDGNDNTTYQFSPLSKIISPEKTEVYGFEIKTLFNGEAVSDGLQQIIFDVYTKSEVDKKIEDFENIIGSIPEEETATLYELIKQEEHRAEQKEEEILQTVNKNTQTIDLFNGDVTEEGSIRYIIAKEIEKIPTFELFPATSERLGGVKIDDKTIQTNGDGQIYVSEISTDNFVQGSLPLVFYCGDAKN